MVNRRQIELQRATSRTNTGGTVGPWPVAVLLACALSIAACGGGGSEEAPDNAGDPGADPGPGSGSGNDPVLTYSIGGSVTGMTGSGLLISNNASDELTLDASGDFHFNDELDDGESYDVQIVTQPSNPANVCTIDNGGGSVNAADVGDVQILCTGPLALTDIAPADGDQNVSRAIDPVLTFSKDIDSSTALPDNLALASDAGAVALAIDVTGAEITLSPDDILLPLTEYTLTVTTGLMGTDGERLPDPVTTMFKTRDGLWQQAELPIDAAGGTANEAQIVFDDSGNALAIWYQASSTGTDLWSNYYTAGVGWGTAELVEHNDIDLYAGSPRAGFDADGNALAVWTQTDGASGGKVWSNSFAPGSGWGSPGLVDSGSGNVTGLVEMAVHPGGDAVAVWVRFDGVGVDILASRHTAGSGWGAATVIDDTSEIVNTPRVSMDADGNALAVWEQSRGTPVDIWSSRYPTAGDWETPVLVSTDNLGKALDPRPAIDADGNALVVYNQENGFDRGIFANRRPAAGAWETPERIGPDQGGHEQQVAFDADGNALAVWEQPVNTGNAVVIHAYASRYTAGSGWDDTPQSISSGDVFYPKIAFDASGHALAVWFELDLSLPLSTGYSVWGNRYTNGSGWTSPEQIGSNGGLIGTFMPNVAIDSNGDAFAIWTRGGEVRVNRFE